MLTFLGVPLEGGFDSQPIRVVAISPRIGIIMVFFIEISFDIISCF